MQEALIALARAAATPTPTPSQVDPNLVTPGPWGFVIILFVAIAAAYLGVLDTVFNFLVQHLL